MIDVIKTINMVNDKCVELNVLGSLTVLSNSLLSVKCFVLVSPMTGPGRLGRAGIRLFYFFTKMEDVSEH